MVKTVKITNLTENKMPLHLKLLPLIFILIPAAIFIIYSIYANSQNILGENTVNEFELFQPSTKKIIDEIEKNQDNPIYIDIDIKTVPVLQYQYIRDTEGLSGIDLEISVTPDNMRKQLEWLRDNNYKTLDIPSLSYFKEKRLKIPQNSVVLTFDGGHRGIYKYLYPLLKEFNFTAEAYITTNPIEKDSSHMNWGMIKEMSNDAVLTVGSHTYDHKRLNRLPDNEVWFQLSESKARLQEKLQLNITGFSYPFGIYDNRTGIYLFELGYKTAVNTKRGNWTIDQNFYEINRISILGSMNVEDFIIAVKGL